MEGFAKSVREIIKASSGGRISGIRGTVAQLINVKQEYATAIETALGGAMQNIIVEDDTAAKRCIRMLKEQRMGRATFLPMTSVRGNVLNEQRLYSENGFVSRSSMPEVRLRAVLPCIQPVCFHVKTSLTVLKRI